MRGKIRSENCIWVLELEARHDANETKPKCDIKIRLERKRIICSVHYTTRISLVSGSYILVVFFDRMHL